MGSKSYVTIGELGRILALDKSTVSLALRDSPRIAAATRLRVQAEARRRDYRPNLAARRLTNARGELQLIGLVLPAALESLSSELAVRAIQVLAGLAAARGLICSLLPASEPLVERDATGPALLPDAAWVWGDVPRARLERLRLGERPLLVVDPSHASWRDVATPCVRLANAAAAALLVAHLAERGARRLLFVRERNDHLGHRARLEGARTAWRARGLGGFSDVALGDLDDARLRAAAGPAGAILASNDAAGLVVRHRLQRLGLASPADVRVAGFDGEPLALRTGLTTAVFDHAALARAAVAGLLDGVAPLEIAATLCIGETT